MRQADPFIMENVINPFSSGNTDLGIHGLQKLIRDEGLSFQTGLNVRYLEKTLDALKSENWDEVGKAFLSGEFVGPGGQILIIGPYRIIRVGTILSELSGIYGVLIPTRPIAELGLLLEKFLNQRPERILEVLSIYSYGGFGLAAGDEGEAFLVPDGWCFPGSETGQAINNMTNQNERFNKFAEKCIREIFSTESAELLLEPLLCEDYIQRRHIEFQYHEAGHASGIGLQRKIREKLLPSTWYLGVEEWRADGIEFNLLLETFKEEEAGKTIAANYTLRFGIDAHREGGLERDTDVIATLLTLNSLFESKALKIGVNRKLSFIDPSYRGLVAASVRHRESALQLTREELTLEYMQGVQGLYGTRRISPPTSVIFEGLVQKPCEQIVTGLQ